MRITCPPPLSRRPSMSLSKVTLVPQTPSSSVLRHLPTTTLFAIPFGLVRRAHKSVPGLLMPCSSFATFMSTRRFPRCSLKFVHAVLQRLLQLTLGIGVRSPRYVAATDFCVHTASSRTIRASSRFLNDVLASGSVHEPPMASRVSTRGALWTSTRRIDDVSRPPFLR